jgi:hypothetical protein
MQGKVKGIETEHRGVILDEIERGLLGVGFRASSEICGASYLIQLNLEPLCMDHSDRCLL